MYRSNSYDEDFSKDMQDPVARREYLLALIHDEDEPMSVEEALRFTIRRMGTVEFADLAGEKKQNVDKYLEPFGLRTVIDVKPIDEKEVA